MKTSNKVLLSFIILVVATPFFLFMGFRNKINKGAFTVIKSHDTNLNYISGPIKPFNVLKVVGPGVGNVFTCTIISAKSATYDYTTYSHQNSVKFQRKGDTLLLKYMGKYQEAEPRVNGDTLYKTYSLNINLHLPDIKNIIAEGANIRTDSFSTATPAIYFDLSKKASLTIVGYGSAEMPIANFTTSTEAFEKSSRQFNKVIIKASDSYVTFEPFTWIKDLDLRISGLSRITVDNKSRINQSKGFISDSTKIIANGKNMHWLTNLTGK